MYCHFLAKSIVLCFMPIKLFVLYCIVFVTVDKKSIMNIFTNSNTIILTISFPCLHDN